MNSNNNQSNKGTFTGSFKSMLGGVLGFFTGIIAFSFIILLFFIGFLWCYDKPKYQTLIKSWNHPWSIMEWENKRKEFYDSFKDGSKEGWGDFGEGWGK